MSDHWLPSTLDALVADASGVLLAGLPGANTLGNAVAQATNFLLRKRSAAAFEILLAELRGGAHPACTQQEVDDRLAMLLRYQRAALEGTARLNLRLMARVFAGLGQTRPLVADEFQSWADVLQGLRRLEIIAIANVHRHTTDRRDKPSPDDYGANEKAFVESLVPSLFRNEDELLAVCQAASRTGLIMQQDDMMLFTYASTPLMDELETLSDFQEVARQEHRAY